MNLYIVEWQPWWIHFHFFWSILSFYPCFCSLRVIQLKILLVKLFLEQLQFVRRFTEKRLMLLHHWQQYQNVSIFSEETCSTAILLLTIHMAYQSEFFTYQLDFSFFWALYLYHLPSCFRICSCFFSLFWMLKMLVYVYEVRFTQWKTSITLLVTRVLRNNWWNINKKKTISSRSWNTDEKEKKSKKRKATVKFFALQKNIINTIIIVLTLNML